jgi:hypothetical protein
MDAHRIASAAFGLSMLSRFVSRSGRWGHSHSRISSRVAVHRFSIKSFVRGLDASEINANCCRTVIRSGIVKRVFNISCLNSISYAFYKPALVLFTAPSTVREAEKVCRLLVEPEYFTFVIRISPL